MSHESKFVGGADSMTWVEPLGGDVSAAEQEALDGYKGKARTARDRARLRALKPKRRR